MCYHISQFIFLASCSLSHSNSANDHRFTMLSLLFLFLFLTLHSSPITSPTYLKLPLIPIPNYQNAPHPLSLSSPIISGASLGTGQYLVHLSLGTPPQPLRLIADTGSDLIWTRCSPCRRGGRRCSLRTKPTSFLPRLSTSFSPFHCYSSSCRLVPRPRTARACNRTLLHTPCRFRYSYADRSSSAGFFSRETATFRNNNTDSRISIRLRFGCAFAVSASQSFDTAHGVLGLGRGPISFASLAGNRFGNTFSYCLMDYTLSPPPASYLLIGNNNNNVTGLSFTPLETNPLSPTFYYIRVLTASVKGIVLPIHPSVWAIDHASGNGGMVVDSGTTLSFFPAPAYKQVVKAMSRALPKAALVSGPPGFDLCINSSITKLVKRLPRLTLRLRGGAKLSPPPRNYFVEAAQGVRCLALQPVGSSTASGFGVVGNLMQQGFLFVFDADRARLGFSRAGCSEL